MLLALAASAQVATGGPYELTRQVVAAGGARATGAGYALTHTVGQPVVGSATGGTYALEQGFHTAAPSGPAPDALFRNGFE